MRDSLQVIEFNSDLHLSIVNQWLHRIDSYQMNAHNIPKIGFIVTYTDDFVAVAFLRMVEGGFAQLDGLATNSHMPAHLRDQAIDLVVEKVLNVADGLKITSVIANTKDYNTLLRSFRHGFVQLPQTLIARPGKLRG